MKLAAAKIEQLSSSEIASILQGIPYLLTLEGCDPVEIDADCLVVKRTEKPGMTVATGDGVTIALETTLTKGLAEEGFAREFVSKIQSIRKDMGLEVSDRIIVKYRYEAPELADALTAFATYIQSETLAVDLQPLPADEAGVVNTEVNDIPIAIVVHRK